jgi:hypothetical protein
MSRTWSAGPGDLGLNYHDDNYKKLPSFVPFVCAEGTGIVPLDLVEAQTTIFFQMLARPGTVPWHLRLKCWQWL